MRKFAGALALVALVGIIGVAAAQLSTTEAARPGCPVQDFCTQEYEPVNCRGCFYINLGCAASALGEDVAVAICKRVGVPQLP